MLTNPNFVIYFVGWIQVDLLVVLIVFHSVVIF